MLALAITLHNIPEGLAVGVIFGGVAAGVPEATVSGAIALALGIGIQNFPEGIAISMPLRRAGFSRVKSWSWGQLSAIVEPIFAVIGAALVKALLNLDFKVIGIDNLNDYYSTSLKRSRLTEIEKVSRVNGEWFFMRFL